MKDPILSLQDTDTGVRLARYHMMHTLKQNKEAHTESETGTDTPTQAYKPGTGSEDSINKELLQTQGLCLQT